MAMSGIIGIINIAQSLGTRNDDDIVDRLHYRYTTTIMLVFSLVVSMTNWVRCLSGTRLFWIFTVLLPYMCTAYCELILN